MKIDLTRVYGVWECPKCDFKTRWYYTDFIESGNPICSDCDEEMELIDLPGELEETKEVVDTPEVPQDAQYCVPVESKVDSYETMDIDAVIGTQVKYHKRTNVPATQDAYIEHKAELEHLLPDKIYTVEHTVIHSSHTDVYLAEVPGIPFNSVIFEKLPPKK